MEIKTSNAEHKFSSIPAGKTNKNTSNLQKKPASNSKENLR